MVAERRERAWMIRTELTLLAVANIALWVQLLTFSQYNLPHIWVGLGLLAGAVALSSLIHNFGPRPMRLGITALLLALSLAVTVGAYWRWDRAERAMRENRPLPYDPLPRLLIAGVAIIIAAAAVLIYLAEAR